MKAIHLLIIYTLVIFLSAFFALLYYYTAISIFSYFGFLGLYIVEQTYYENGNISFQVSTPLMSYFEPFIFGFFGLLLLRANNNTFVKKAKYVAVSYIILCLFTFMQNLMQNLLFSTGQYSLLQIFNQFYNFLTIFPLLAVVLTPFFIKVYTPVLTKLKRRLYLYLPLSFTLSVSLQSYLRFNVDSPLIDSLAVSLCSLIFFYLLRDYNQDVVMEAVSELAYPQASQTPVPTVK